MDLRKSTKYRMSLSSIDIFRASSTTSSPKREKYRINLQNYSMTTSVLRKEPINPSVARLPINSRSFVLATLKLLVILI